MKKMPSGYGMILQSVMIDKRISIEAKAIYSLLCSYTGDKNYCFPKVETITSNLNISKKRFYKHMDLLIKYNLVIKSKLYDDIRNNNKYEIMLPCESYQNDTDQCSQNDTVEDSQNEHFQYSQNDVVINSNIINSNSNNNNIIKEKKHKKIEYPSSVDEVKKYSKENKLNVDCDFFYQYFTIGNWVDKNGKKVLNWKQKLLTWSKHNKSETKRDYKDKTSIPELVNG